MKKYILVIFIALSFLSSAIADENAVEEYKNLIQQTLTSLDQAREEIKILKSDLDLKYTEIITALKEQKNMQESKINDLKIPKECRWLTVTTGGHGAAAGKQWMQSCPSGFYMKSYRLSTWERFATFDHSMECCAL